MIETESTFTKTRNIENYLDRIRLKSKGTIKNIEAYLRRFDSYLQETYNKPHEEILDEILSMESKQDVVLCGIRGSDMVFSYDPQQEKLSVFANEGEVSVKSETAGNTKMVTAGQSVIVEKGHINPVSQMPDFVWDSAKSKTIIPEAASDQNSLVESKGDMSS